ncbi:MAG TPA: hypothetical protein VF079_04765 [Sphingomicrobium sp.]
MDWLIPAIIGWCGTGWRPRIPGIGGGVPGGTDPDNPWPPNCWVCGGIIGALAAVVLDPVYAPMLQDAGFLGRAVMAFGTGFVANQIVGGAVGMVRGRK